MTIPSFKLLKSNAAGHLAASEQSGRIIALYTGILTAMALLVTVVNFTLNLQIGQLGGLSNMGTRSVLSTIQSILPMIQSAVMMCLEIGYFAAVLRIARRQYASPQTLKLGFDRFWLLLRCTLLQSFLYMGICFLALWASCQIFLMSPLASPVQEILEPLTANPSFSLDLLMEEATYSRLVQAMIPLFVLFGLVYAAICIPVIYSFRMVNYVIIDKPAISAVGALKESRVMMKGHRMRLFKLDVSFWWWYLAMAALSVVCYGDTLLPMAGVTLPFSSDVAYFIFFIVYLAGQFALFFFLRNRVEVVYAQVYDKLRPREKDTGVVLGNIFQM